MGYACPVCADPQADPGHLANHLAFTAMLGDADHEAWLDDHAPGWGEMGEADLAEAVVDHGAETEFPQVFEDTAGGLDDAADPPSERSGALFDDDAGGARDGHEHASGHGHGHTASAGHRHASGASHDQSSGPAQDHDPDHSQPQARGDHQMDEEAAAILEEAREMTRRMLEDETADGADASTDPAGETDGSGPDDGEGPGEGADADAGVDNNE